MDSGYSPRPDAPKSKIANQKAKIVNLGQMDYAPCAELQRRLLERVAAGEAPDTLLFVEHEPVLTLGADFHDENLLLTPAQYEAEGIHIHRTERGGDVTYHGPDQLVIYPIFNLNNHGRDLHKWMRNLEETIIRTMAAFDLEGYRFPPNTGVWIDGRKIAAIGVKVRRWTSMHGIALNCANDLRPFSLIIPCGIQEHGVTSLTQELGRHVGYEDALPRVAQAFEEAFGLTFEQQTRAELEQMLG